MPARPRRYPKKPLAAQLVQHGNRIYGPRRAPLPGSSHRSMWRLRLPQVRLGGRRASQGHPRIEAYLADGTPIRSPGPPPNGRRPSRGLSAHLGGRSVRYRERQDALLRRWVLPSLGEQAVSTWTTGHELSHRPKLSHRSARPTSGRDSAEAPWRRRCLGRPWRRPAPGGGHCRRR